MTSSLKKEQVDFPVHILFELPIVQFVTTHLLGRYLWFLLEGTDEPKATV